MARVGIVIVGLFLAGCATAGPSAPKDATQATADRAECRAEAQHAAASAGGAFPRGDPASRFPDPFIRWPSDVNRQTYGPTVDPSARFEAEHRAYVDCMQHRGYAAEDLQRLDR